jgi:hypothetical protein
MFYFFHKAKASTFVFSEERLNTKAEDIIKR